MNKKIIFETYDNQDLGFCEIRTYFEVDEDKIHLLEKMTKKEFFEFLKSNAKVEITDASPEIENIEFKDFDKI